MMISVAVMVGSFRETVEVWLENQLRADIYLRAAGPPAAGVYPPIAAAGRKPRTRRPPASPTSTFFTRSTSATRACNATFGAGDTDVIRRHSTLRFLSGDADDILRPSPATTAPSSASPSPTNTMSMSATFSISRSARDVVPLTVAGIYYDYSSDRGFVLVDRGTLLKVLPGPAHHQHRGLRSTRRR